jgi:branched-chain amino acid aminotransferase
MPSAFVIDGEVVPPERAVVPVLDRGFLYGDGIYEVIRTAGGRPVDLERHLDRLESSAARIALGLPPRVDLVRWIRAALVAGGNPESYLRVVVTRGAGPIGLDIALADGPRTVIIAAPLVVPDAELYRRGVDLAVVSVERTSARALDPAVKSGNYLNNILGLAEARGRGAHEAILLNPAGEVAEGSTSNLFVVSGGRLRTPALSAGILAGITRRRVLEIAAAGGDDPVEDTVTVADLAVASEAFLTSSIRGVMPVRSIDDRSLPAAPGPTTARLMAAYDGFLAAVAADPG